MEGMNENYKLVKSIVLNGKVDWCDTHDDCGSAIGVKEIVRARKLDGTYVETVTSEFPLSQRMDELIGWRDKYASVSMLTGDTPIDLDHIDETKVVSMCGMVESTYYHQYSDYTGYLWTTQRFKCGGHDLLNILHSHINEYIHLEIDLYEKVAKR